ncbi:MAG: GGDEF domain-containing protein [Lachnospiraceae bacterium]|nr:GGDEF domain-containing protein [Lachnospiraceae bacterium]
MGFDKRDKDENLKPVLLVATIVLAACMLVCSYFIFDMAKKIRRDAERNFQEHVSVAGQVITSSMEGMQKSVTSAADAITVQFRSAADDEKIRSILKEYQNVSGIAVVTYVETNGMTHFADKPKEVATLGGDLKLVMKSEPYSEVSAKYQLDGTTGVVLATAPVYKSDRQVGSVVAIKSLAGTLEDKSFDYLKSSGQLFLIDKSGSIYEQAGQQLGLKSVETNIFRRLQTMTGKNNARNRDALQSLKEHVNEEDYVVKSLETESGSDLYVMVYNIDVAQKLFFVQCYSESLISGKVQAIAISGIISCSLIVLLMVALIFFIWFYTKKSSKVIRKLAYEDPVTKGKNFNYFVKKAAELVHENKEIPYLVQRFDISNFRYLNEAYGHDKADRILSIIIEQSRENFHGHELCVRMNSDQFVVLAQNSAEYVRRFAIFEDNVNLRAIDEGIKFPIRFKSGIYQVRRSDTDINVMVDRANVARRSLSADSKEVFAYYSDRIISDMRKVEQIEADQQNALINGEFKVFLQPKWDIVNDRLYGAEALVRWIKDDGTMVYPDMFIPVFENNGFIEQLDFYMLECVCAELCRLLDEGKQVFPISVNQSRRLWDNPEYVANVDRIIKKYNIPSHYVELEVTETVFFGEKDKMLSIIAQLKQKEVMLSMDDFGSGYSSLNLLKDVPFDILKIDREFFSESITSKSSTWILKKIIEMAEGLGTHVLCEGVETAEQVELLRSLGCQYVQGYYYSKPIPLSEFVEKYVS